MNHVLKQPVPEPKTPVSNGTAPALLTEQELIHFLRIPEVSKSQDYHNVIENLVRYRDLPRIHICNKKLYPKQAILQWIEKETVWK